MIEQRDFDGVAASVSRARSFVVSAADADGHTSDVLRLVVSELATNAVIHAGTDFNVKVMGGGGLLRVEVADSSSTLPTTRGAGLRSVTGRGLSIVEQMVSQWGVIPEIWGKRVWFELTATL